MFETEHFDLLREIVCGRLYAYATVFLIVIHDSNIQQHVAETMG